MDTVSVVFLSISLVGCCSQRLKAERELDRDLKEAEATESREKKTKLVGGEGDIEPWLLLSQASPVDKTGGWRGRHRAMALAQPGRSADKTGGWRGRHRAMALAQPGLSCCQNWWVERET